MSRTRALLSILMFTTTAHFAHAQRGNPSVEWAGESVDETIATFMSENAVPGMSLAIVQAPYVTRVEGFGVADTATRTLASSNTIFDIGQMRDAFTAVAIMQLVEKGKLALDDKSAQDGKSIREMLRAPASYSALEQLVADSVGESFADFVKREQFERLGLRHTFFGADLGNAKREKFAEGGHHTDFLTDPQLINPTEPASGYRAADEKAVPVDPDAIYSSSLDISLWDIGLAGGILIKDAELRKILYRPATLADGNTIPTSGPWVFPGHEGLMVSTGSASGFSSLLSRFTRSDELVCVTLLANKECLDLTQLARRIAGAFNPKLGPPASTATMRVQQSPWPVAETIDRLDKILRDRGVGILARIDHSKAAKSAGLDLRPTEELIFGNPAKGTLLMQVNPATVVDLPLRAAAWEEDGGIWLAATDPVEIGIRHGIEGRESLLLEMRKGIDSALLKAVSPE